jgi:AsmA-like protein
VKLFSSKRRLAAVALILLALFLVRPGASRLKSRLIFSISASVGRPVDIGAVHIRLLPRPGFDLQNLVVYDDPSFSAEPILRAGEVTAVLRLTSLIRGRLEVARLDLTEPSLNLVHGEAGHWNLEGLLERTARLPLAPTGKTKSEPRPAFPYIQGTSGRINFKNGPEKKPYALTNADFSLWHESENSWGVRLKAQPFRTDKNLNDMGLLQVNATWQRAATIRDTPLEATVEWSRAQLGQITNLISGNDQGWRGTILLDVSFKGTPAKLAISSRAAIDDFRRYDITSGKALRVAGYCDGEYRSATQDFHQVMCSAPVGDGLITLTGDMALPGRHRYSLLMTAEKVPVNAAVMLAQRAKKNLPDDLAADGEIEASLSMQADAEAESQNRFQGRGEITDFHLVSAGNKAEIGPVTVPLAMNSGSSAGESSRSRHVVQNGPLIHVPAESYVEIGPFAMGAAHAGSPIMTGWISRGGYTFTITGETDIARTLRAARMAGLPALIPAADGAAQMNLRIAGTWAGPVRGDGRGFAAPQITGDAKLQSVQIAAHTLGGPVEIVSADMQFLPDTIHVGKLTAKAAGTTWTGSLEMPRGCGTPDACPVRFALNTNQVTITDINAWVNSGPKKRPWYRVLESSAETQPSIFGSLRASGRLTADHLKVRRMDATHVSANVNLERGKLQLSQVNAALANGEHRGEWKVDFSVKPAICTGSGKLSALSLAGLAAALNDAWIGTANATYQVKGSCPADFWQSADGTLQVEIQDGVFPHISIADRNTEPLRVTRMSGQARLHAGKIAITDTKVDSAEGKFQLTGTASLQREVDLKLTRVSNTQANSGYTISGTLAAPRITPLAASEQARLKALPTK